jgi:hypothetical protein
MGFRVFLGWVFLSPPQMPGIFVEEDPAKNCSQQSLLCFQIGKEKL